MFDIVQNSPTFLLEIIILASSANIMGSDKVFTVEGRSLMYKIKNKGPIIDPWETPCFIVPQFEKKF
jgi:hypothetical protein